MKNETLTHILYRVDYISTHGDKMFYIAQNVIDGSDVYVDSELGIIKEVSVNQFPAMLVECYETDNKYMLIWQDYNYRYTIFGTFESVSELFKIADGIK